MSTHENIDNQAPETELESGKVQLQLSNEIEPKKIKIHRENKERAIALPYDELELRHYLLTGYYITQKKPGMSNFLQMVDEVINLINEGDFSSEQANGCLQVTLKLFSESMEICHEKGIKYPGTISHILLSRVIELMKYYLEWIEGDQSDEFDGYLQNSLFIQREKDSSHLN